MTGDPCKGQVTHYQGCDCHEAEWAAQVEAYREKIKILKAEVEHLMARKCSHGDYRMQGTTDCKNEEKCSGRTEFYVIGEGLCISCIHAAQRSGE